nr:hypothetical protein [Tanacetum cinerariifolium]
PITAAASAGKAAVVVVAVVLGVDGDGVNGCCRRWYRDGEGGGAARCGCGGVVSTVEDGGPYRLGYGESFWVRQKSSPEKLSDSGRGGGRRRLPEIWERERGL